MSVHFGKYRGVVRENVDPLGHLRIRFEVPALFPEILEAWALPCLPGAGPGCGMALVPPIGANVWIEFEGGDSDFPIWSGGFWDKPEDVPPQQKACLPLSHGRWFAPFRPFCLTSD